MEGEKLIRLLVLTLLISISSYADEKIVELAENCIKRHIELRPEERSFKPTFKAGESLSGFTANLVLNVAIPNTGANYLNKFEFKCMDRTGYLELCNRSFAGNESLTPIDKVDVKNIKLTQFEKGYVLGHFSFGNKFIQGKALFKCAILKNKLELMKMYLKNKNSDMFSKGLVIFDSTYNRLLNSKKINVSYSSLLNEIRKKSDSLLIKALLYRLKLDTNSFVKPFFEEPVTKKPRSLAAYVYKSGYKYSTLESVYFHTGGTDIDVGYMSLILAIERSDIEAVKLFLDHLEKGLMAYYCEPQTIILALKKIPSSGMVDSVELDILRLLLRAGADVNKKNRNGKSALDIARQSPFHRLVLNRALETVK